MAFSRRAVAGAIRLHAPPGFRSSWRESAWRDLQTDGLECGAFVVAADVRESTSLMKEAANPVGFARALHEFATAARENAHDTIGWFDKFSGDGFIVYCPEFLGEAAETRASQALEFARRTQASFPAVMERFRQNCQNLPAGAGLALGLDSGDCQLAIVGTELTIIGSPVVGAVRMVAAASEGQVLTNVHLGEALTRGFVTSPRLKTRRTVVRTKEYPEGQEAYLVEFSARSTKRKSKRAR